MPPIMIVITPGALALFLVLVAGWAAYQTVAASATARAWIRAQWIRSIRWFRGGRWM